MIKFFAQLLKVCLSGLLAVGILSFFTLFYYYPGIAHPNPSGATDYRFEPHQLCIECQEGNGVLRLDAYGFNNLNADFERPINNLMMGDSQMRGVHVNAHENTVAVLNELCPEQYTYNIGMSAHYLYTCIKNIENALEEYKPTTLVLINTVSVALDMNDMQRVLSGEYETLPAEAADKWTVRLKKCFPSLPLMYSQLREWIGLNTENMAGLLPAQDASTEEYRDTLNAFLHKAADAAERHGVQLVIFYIPPVEIEPGGGMVCQTDPEMLALFADTCERNGIIFLDMTADFNALYEQEHKAPYGFANTRVGKGHMNKYGYRVVAGRLAQALNDL